MANGVAECTGPTVYRRRHPEHTVLYRAVRENLETWLKRLPKPLPSGRQVLHLTPLELLEKLSKLIPPPRKHRHRYYGVLALLFHDVAFVARDDGGLRIQSPNRSANRYRPVFPTANVDQGDGADNLRCWPLFLSRLL